MRFFSDCKTDDERKAIYRKLSKLFHPDHGGDAELMTELNTQYHNNSSTCNSGSVFIHPYSNLRSNFSGLDNELYKQLQASEMMVELLQRDNQRYKDRLQEYLNLIRDIRKEVKELEIRESVADGTGKFFMVCTFGFIIFHVINLIRGFYA